MFVLDFPLKERDFNVFAEKRQVCSILFLIREIQIGDYEGDLKKITLILMFKDHFKDHP